MIRTWQLMAGLATCMALTAPSEAAQSVDGVLACRGIADSASRLACFDKAAAALTPAPPATPVSKGSTPSNVPVASPAPPPPSAPVTPPPPDPKAQFGLPERTVAAQEVAAGTRAADASKIEAHLSQVSSAADQRLIFTLDNGQVWRQLSANGTELLAKPGESLVISRGALGSYWMQLASGRGCKVTRLH